MLQQTSDIVSWSSKQLQQLIPINSSSGTSAVAGAGVAAQLEQQQQQQHLQRCFSAVRAVLPDVMCCMLQQDQTLTCKGAHANFWLLCLGIKDAIGYQLLLQSRQYSFFMSAVLPTKLCCNNPDCSTIGSSALKQWSELACVDRKKCSKCMTAAYCSQEVSDRTLETA